MSHTASGSVTGANSHSQAPSGKSVTTSAATWRARRVLPTPPTPVRVTNDDVRTSSASDSISASRPTKVVIWRGRLPGNSVNDRNGGKSRPSSGCTTWYTPIASAKSRNRCSPRSTKVNSAGSPLRAKLSTVSETTTWPPWAIAINRAHRFNGWFT